MEKLGSNRNGSVAAARQAGPGSRSPARLAEGPGAQGQEEAAEDGDELEGDVVGDEGVEQDGDQPGQREVEGVEGEAVVPARVPSGHLAVGQQVRLRGRPAGRRAHPVSPPAVVVFEEQQVRVQLGQHHDDDAEDGHRARPRRPGGAAGHPHPPRRADRAADRGDRPADAVRPRPGRATAVGPGIVDRRRHRRRPRTPRAPCQTRPRSADQGRQHHRGQRQQR